jgi:hypothetical protein
MRVFTNRSKKEFISKSREYARYICRHFPLNYNWIDAEYFAGVKWLLFLGATVYEAQPLGDSKHNFHYFKFGGGDLWPQQQSH